MLFRCGSIWFRWEYKTPWAVYFKEDIYFMYIILEIGEWNGSTFI